MLMFIKALGTHVPEIDERLYMLMLVLPLILINWVRNLKFLVPFSTVANIVTFASFGIILYYIFRDPLDFGDRAPVGEVKNFPLFFGTVLFALEAIGVVRIPLNLLIVVCKNRNHLNRLIYVYLGV